MKKYINVGLVIALTIAVVGFKVKTNMDILELASIQPFLF